MKMNARSTTRFLIIAILLVVALTSALITHALAQAERPEQVFLVPLYDGETQYYTFVNPGDSIKYTGRIMFTERTYIGGARANVLYVYRWNEFDRTWEPMGYDNGRLVLRAADVFPELTEIPELSWATWGEIIVASRTDYKNLQQRAFLPAVGAGGSKAQ